MVDDSGEDEHDAEIARARAREIKRDPKQLVRGKALEDELGRCGPAVRRVSHA